MPVPNRYTDTQGSQLLIFRLNVPNKFVSEMNQASELNYWVSVLLKLKAERATLLVTL